MRPHHARAVPHQVPRRIVTNSAGGPADRSDAVGGGAKRHLRAQARAPIDAGHVAGLSVGTIPKGIGIGLAPYRTGILAQRLRGSAGELAHGIVPEAGRVGEVRVRAVRIEVSHHVTIVPRPLRRRRATGRVRPRIIIVHQAGVAETAAPGVDGYRSDSAAPCAVRLVGRNWLWRRWRASSSQRHSRGHLYAHDHGDARQPHSHDNAYADHPVGGNRKTTAGGQIIHYILTYTISNPLKAEQRHRGHMSDMSNNYSHTHENKQVEMLVFCIKFPNAFFCPILPHGNLLDSVAIQPSDFTLPLKAS